MTYQFLSFSLLGESNRRSGHSSQKDQTRIFVYFSQLAAFDDAFRDVHNTLFA